jgi:hypothetical protein
MAAVPDVAVQQPVSSVHHPLPLPHPHSSLAAPPTLESPDNVAVWTNPNPPRPRGRAPKDPHAYVAKYNCSSLQDLETNLRSYLDTQPAPPEHSSCELTIWAGASFMVTLPPPDSAAQQNAGMLQPVADALRAQNGLSNGARPDAPQDKVAMSVLDALQPLADSKETMKRQRAISKVCIASIQKVDGFRYSFHNTWKSGEDNAYRFSWYCNDSLLNKDRVANGKSGSQGKRATKPVFDCKGVLSIKFSATRQCIDVIYKHNPIHDTYEKRAPPPRRHAKRRQDWELANPDKVRQPREGDGESEENRSVTKRQKRLEPFKKLTSTESEIRKASLDSLLLLIRGDEYGATTQNQTPTQEATPSHLTPYEIPPSAAPPRSTLAGASHNTPSRPARICEICISRKMKVCVPEVIPVRPTTDLTQCNGARPRCQPCAERDWPCFYTQNGANGQQQYVISEVNSTDSVEQRALAALSVAQVNDLKQELQDMNKSLDEKAAEVQRLKASLEEQGSRFNELVQRNKQLEADLNKAKETAQSQQQAQPKQQVPQAQPQQSLGTYHQSYGISPSTTQQQQQQSTTSYQAQRVHTMTQQRSHHSQTYPSYQTTPQGWQSFHVRGGSYL